MFQGSPHITLDGKGRFAVPARFRAQLDELCSGELTFTRHPDGCALLYPRPAWEEKRKELMALPFAARTFQRIVMGSATDADMDKNGRLLIPAEIRQACGLNNKDIVLVGLGNHFEIWDAERLAKLEEDAKSQNLEEIVANFNF